jgi:DNA-binding transcriptional MerR regulator
MEVSVFDKEFLTISEFADIVGVSVRTLQYYDEIGVFPAAKHGIENENKYRYYTPEQITTYKMVRVMRDMGIHLLAIKESAANRSPENLTKMLTKQKREVDSNISCLQDSSSIIGIYLELLYEGISADETELLVSEMKGWNITLGDINDFSGAKGFHREYMRFCTELHEPLLNLAYPVGGYFESMDDFLNEPSLPTRFFSIDPNGRDTKDAGLYLSGYARGYYGQTCGLPEKMANYAKDNELEFIGPVYNIYLFDEMSIVEPDKYLLQASVAVKKTKHESLRWATKH